VTYRNVVDTDNYAASGIETFQFAGGEWHANVPVWPVSRVHVHAKLRTADDVMCLLGVLDAFGTQRVEVHLFAPYFPGLRQDRNPEGKTPLTSRIFGRMLAPLCATITTVDAHSAEGMHNVGQFMHGGPKNFIEIKPDVFLSDLIIPEWEPGVVFAPDKGAVQRSTEASVALHASLALAEKDRDFATGRLKGFKVTRHPYTNGRVLIADDICDGGGTFVGLLEEIRKFYPDNPVDLYVTHGIFSKGFDVLKGFDRIYTTDSWYRSGGTLSSIKLLPYYFGGLRP
jgi:ribose-phosphate pyrophosphokinase